MLGAMARRWACVVVISMLIVSAACQAATSSSSAATSTTSATVTSTSTSTTLPAIAFTGTVDGSTIENSNTIDTSIVSTGALYSDNPYIGITQTLDYSNITITYSGPNLITLATATAYHSSGAAPGRKAGSGTFGVAWMPVIAVMTALSVGGFSVIGRL